MSSVTSTFKFTIMGLMIISGAINTISNLFIYQAYKFQNTQYVYEGGHYKLFFHPYMQVVLFQLRQSQFSLDSFLLFSFILLLKKEILKDSKLDKCKPNQKVLKLSSTNFGLLYLPSVMLLLLLYIWLLLTLFLVLFIK